MAETNSGQKRDNLETTRENSTSASSNLEESLARRIKRAKEMTAHARVTIAIAIQAAGPVATPSRDQRDGVAQNPRKARRTRER